MDGWMDGWMDAQVDGWRVKGCICDVECATEEEEKSMGGARACLV